MSTEDAVLELLRGFGRMEADVAAIKLDVAELKAAPAKKSQRRWQMVTGLVAVVGLLFTAVKVFAR